MTTNNEFNDEKCLAISEKVEPLVISEVDHPIRRHDFDKEALKVLYRLRDAGYSGFLVGGGVRDLYMGKYPKDFDISTNARPGQLRKLFRNSRTIGRRFRLVQVFFRGGKIIEVSTLRSQSEYDIDGVDKILPCNNTYGTPGEDAFRRDLTINALFYEVEHNTIIDYVGGVQDLDRGVVRIIGEPDRRVVRDPVRIMRAVRHAARNGFRIENATWEAIVKNRDKLDLCPPSRIRDELLKDLSGGKSEPWARICLECQMFFTLFPFYRDILSRDSQHHVQEKLFSLLRVIDRLHNTSSHDYQIELPDYFILAVLLLPWAEDRFDLMNQHLKGRAHYTLSRKIRADLDDVLGERLSLKRMAKEAMTTLLLNLPSFTQYQGKKSWPRWLRGKSYFSDCFRFYNLVSEAGGGDLVDDDLFRNTSGRRSREAAGFSGRSGFRNNGRRRRSRPAFSDRKKGVFGLRRN